MNTLDTFNAEVSPQIVVIDLNDQRRKIANPMNTLEAIIMCDLLQEMSGSGNTIQCLPENDGYEEDAILLYYTSYSGRPNKEEIARVGRVLARCGSLDVKNNSRPLRISGSRVVAFPEVVGPNATTAVFMVSTRVWYNNNRSVSNFPANDVHREEVLKDINSRLSEGQVSFPR